VSASLFMSNNVRVQGFPWCKDSPKVVGLSALTAKILCTTHNNALSSVDTAGAEAFSVLREMMRLSNVRKKMKPRIWNTVRYKINGRALERWFLKTLINFSYDGGYPIGRASTLAGRPTEHLVRVAYGLASFEGRAGLYTLVRPGMQFNSDDTVGFSPLIMNSGCIECDLFSFRGLRFLLSLEPGGPPQPLSGVYFEGEDLGHLQLNFHNHEVNENTVKFRSQVQTIAWDSTT
jgi:hypothetical protein